MFEAIKAKIKNIGNWMKSKTKKILISLGIIGVTIAAGVTIDTKQDKINAIQDLVYLDGQEMAISYMGETIGVDFIIKSNSKSYDGVNRGIPVYFSITNVSGEAQNIRIAVSLNGEKLEWGSVKKFIENKEVMKDIWVEHYTSTKTATGTNILSENVLVSTTTLKTIWKDMSSVPKLPVIDYSRKALFGLNHEKEVNDFLTDKETAYYRTDIFKTGKVNEEFIIEVFGDQGGYGYLDPLIDNFDSYNDGNLNGQGGWTAQAATNVQGTVFYGASGKALGKTGDLTAGSNYVSITSEADGNQIVYLQYNATANGNVGVILYENTTILARIYIDASAAKALLWGAAFTQIAGSLSTGTWYKLEIQWRSSDWYVQGRMDDGTWTGWLAPVNTITTGVNKIGVWTNNTGAVYWDEFSETGAEEEPIIPNIIWF